MAEILARRGRGFASMSDEKRKQIASKGGKASHELGRAHTWTSEEARAAGRKGGSVSRRRPRLVRIDTESLSLRMLAQE